MIFPCLNLHQNIINKSCLSHIFVEKSCLVGLDLMNSLGFTALALCCASLRQPAVSDVVLHVYHRDRHSLDCINHSCSVISICLVVTRWWTAGNSQLFLEGNLFRMILDLISSTLSHLTLSCFIQ